MTTKRHGVLALASLPLAATAAAHPSRLHAGFMPHTLEAEGGV